VLDFPGSLDYVDETFAIATMLMLQFEKGENDEYDPTAISKNDHGSSGRVDITFGDWG
jgi:hypothetical protein